MKNVRCRRDPKVMGGTFTRHRWDRPVVVKTTINHNDNSVTHEREITCFRCGKLRNPAAGAKMLRLATDKSEGQ